MTAMQKRRKRYYMPVDGDEAEIKDRPYVEYDTEPANFRRKLVQRLSFKLKEQFTDDLEVADQLDLGDDLMNITVAYGIVAVGGDWSHYPSYWGTPPEWPFDLGDVEVEYKRKIVGYFAQPETIELHKRIQATFFPSAEELGKSEEPPK